MVGLTYIEFKPQDFCYIVVFTPVENQEVIEFLEGKVKEVSSIVTVPPLNHPLLRYPQSPPKIIRAIHAEVTDSKAAYRNPIDPIKLNQEPQRHYLVVPHKEYVRYLNEFLVQTQDTLEMTQDSLERTQKMNVVQQQRINNLEAMLHQPQKRKSL